MTNRKGDGAAGGGLAARIKDWEGLPKATPVGPNSKKIDGLTFHRPGSQNSRKGGRGKPRG